MAISVTKPYFTPECRKRISEGIESIMASGQLILGPFKNKLEAAFVELVSAPYAVSVNTCTTALIICLKHYDVTGREVLVPSGSFITDVSAVQFAGGTPVLVDMDPATLSFDLDDLKRKLTRKTKGIVWVHLTGIISPQYKEIVAFAKKHDLFLIEDCAHAHGASVDGMQAGSIGDAGCFSFFATKVLTSGTGGLLTTRDEKLKRYAEEMRQIGKDIKTGEVVHVSSDWFLDEFRACIAYNQFLDLDAQIVRRRAIAARYSHALTSQPGISLLRIPAGNLPSYYQYAVFLDRAARREPLIRRLKENHKIETKRIYLPTHQEIIFKQYDNGTLRRTEDTLDRSLCLPMSAQLTDGETDTVIAALKEELKAVA